MLFSILSAMAWDLASTARSSRPSREIRSSVRTWFMVGRAEMVRVDVRVRKTEGVRKRMVMVVERLGS